MCHEGDKWMGLRDPEVQVLISDYSCSWVLEHMGKKFEINRTKIKGGCQSWIERVTHNAKSDLPLVQLQCCDNLDFEIRLISLAIIQLQSRNYSFVKEKKIYFHVFRMFFWQYVLPEVHKHNKFLIQAANGLLQWWNT